MKMHKSHQVKHPGVVFKERFLSRHGISNSEAARKLHMSREQVSRFVNGHSALTRELAKKLEVSTGVSMKYWLSRQMAHDLQQAETLQVDAEPLLD